MTDQKKIRAFIALQPPKEWIDALQHLQKQLQNGLPSEAIRWIEVEQIHLTLRFLGYISADTLSEITGIMDNVVNSIGAFALRYDGLSCFPRIKDPRVIWAGLKCDNSNLDQLDQNLRAATKEIGEPPEDRPFKPHLSLARVKNLERKFIPKLEAIMSSTEFHPPGNWTVAEVLLMQSHLSPKGARYEPLHRTSLGLTKEF